MDDFRRLSSRASMSDCMSERPRIPRLTHRRSVFAPTSPLMKPKAVWLQTKMSSSPHQLYPNLRPINNAIASRTPLGRLRSSARSRRRSGGNPRLSRYTLPFERFAKVAGRVSWTQLEMRRFHGIPSELLEACWDARRGHAPCGEMVPLERDLDAIYFRSLEERP
jgi:hypothetical protein